MFAVSSAQKQNRNSTTARLNNSNTGGSTLQHKSNGHDVDALSNIISNSSPIYTLSRLPVQTKLKIGEPEDKYEKEADRVAGIVSGQSMEKMPAISKIGSGGISSAHQTKKENEEKKKEEEENKKVQRLLLKRKGNEKEEEDKKLQRLLLKRKAGEKEEEETAQLKYVPPAGSIPKLNKTNSVEKVLSGSSGETISPAIRGKMEARMGVDLSGIKVHTDSTAGEAAAELNARAFTHKENIWLGRGESPTDVSLMSHEATHVVQQNAASATHGSVQRSTGAGTAVIQRSWWDDVTGAAGAVWDATGGRLVNAAGELIEMGSDFFWSMVERLAPSLAPVLREISSKGIFTYLYEKISGTVTKIFDKLSANSEVLAVLIDSFKTMAVSAKEILEALASGDCGPMFKAVERLKETISKIAGDAWDAIVEFFKPIGDFFSDIWKKFGAPVVEWLTETAGEVWQAIKDLGAQIWSWTQPVRDALSAAWNWVKEKLGLTGGEGDDQGGLIQWVKDKAGEVWDNIKEQLQPVIGPIQSVIDKVKEILPLDAILNLRETVQGWLQNVGSMTASLSEEDKVADQQVSLRDEILPAVLKTIQSLRLSLISTGEWVSNKIGSIVTIVSNFMSGLRSNSILSMAATAIEWVETKVNQLAEWAQNTVVSLFTFIGDGLVKLSSFVEPILNTLQKIVEVLGNLIGKLPDLVFGSVWKIIPACIRNPIKDFLINKILANIPVFGQILKLPDIWAKIKDTALRILKKVFVDGDLIGAAWTFFKSLLNVIGIPPELVLGIISKAAAALLDIITNPVGFLINLLKAVKEGFIKFFDNIGKHLLGGVTGWLFGQVSSAGLTPPKDFSIKSIFGFVLQILDITKERIFKKLEQKLGSPLVEKIKGALNFLTGAWEWVSILWTEGPAGVWNKLKEKISDLWNQLITGVIGWITTKVIEKATVWLLSFLDISGIMPVINSIIAIYKAIQSFAQYFKQMLEIVNSVLDGILGIAKGAIEKAASFLEQSLARSIPIIIGFLANQVGLGKLGSFLKNMAEKAREKVDAAFDWIIDKAMAAGTAFLETIKSAGAAVKAGVSKLFEWWKKEKKFTDKNKKSHRLFFKGTDKNAELMVESNLQKVNTFLESAKIEGDSDQNSLIEGAKAKYKEIEDTKNLIAQNQSKIETLPANDKQIDTLKKEIKDHDKTLTTKFADLSDYLAKLNLDDPITELTRSKIDKSGDTPPTWVESTPLTEIPGEYKGSPPGSDPLDWSICDYINNSKLTPKGNPSIQWVRMHLLNQQLHGPGEKWNLTPGRQGTNDEMKRGGEKTAKDAIKAKDKKLYSYKTIVVYHGDKVIKGLKDKDDPTSDEITLGNEKTFPSSVSIEFGEATKNKDGSFAASRAVVTPILDIKAPDPNEMDLAAVFSRVSDKVKDKIRTNPTGLWKETVYRALNLNRVINKFSFTEVQQEKLQKIHNPETALEFSELLTLVAVSNTAVPTTLNVAATLSSSERTVRRHFQKLASNDYIEDTGTKEGKAPIYKLLPKGATAVTAYNNRAS